MQYDPVRGFFEGLPAATVWTRRTTSPSCRQVRQEGSGEYSDDQPPASFLAGSCVSATGFAAGASIDVPLGHKDDVWSFDEIDTVTVMIPGAPRPEEIVVIVALADGGRPRPRVAKSGAVPPRKA